MAPVIRCLFALTYLVSTSVGLDNGLALTPPMGWLTWERYRCITDCDLYPDECISENLIKKVVDLVVSEGYKDAGYQYIGIDDCWLERERGKDGKLVPDRKRFPSGLKALADYIHSKGLLFALYEDYGNLTCAGYPGVLHHEKADVASFVQWDVDYIKLDGCYVDDTEMDTGYPAFGALLNASGRPILYSCSWPAYQKTPNYPAIAESCNIWRNWDDIEDSWESVRTIFDWFGDNQEQFAHLAGPGHFNDPDMLIIGNYGLSVTQAEVQMALWSVMAAPLMMSADLQHMTPEFKSILLNREVIAVNQDPLGRQGRRVFKETTKGNARKGLEVWTRQLSDGGYAVAFVSQRDDGAPRAAAFTQQEAGLPTGNYHVKNLYRDTENMFWRAGEDIKVRIKPTGVEFFKLTPAAEDFRKNIDLDVNNDFNDIYK